MFIFHLGIVVRQKLPYFVCLVCSHIVGVPTSSLGDEVVGVHLSSDQMTYDLMVDADLYNSF